MKGYIVKRCHYPIALLEWRTFPFQRQLPHTGFPGGSVVKNPPANAGDVGLIPGSGRSPREENDNPLRCSCLGNPMDRGAWWASVHGVARVRHDLVSKPPPINWGRPHCKITYNTSLYGPSFAYHILSPELEALRNTVMSIPECKVIRKMSMPVSMFTFRVS